MVCIRFPHQSIRLSLLNILNGTKNACREARLLSADICTIEVLFRYKKAPPAGGMLSLLQEVLPVYPVLLPDYADRGLLSDAAGTDDELYRVSGVLLGP